jgi:nucleolar MIF4G domain-containing protein 1
MPPKQQRPYNHAARKRTATLPKSIRQELEQLGHIDPQPAAKGRLGRKDRRKAERNAPKQNRAQNQGGPTASKKRGADEQPPVASTSKASDGTRQDDATQPPAKKRARTADSDETSAAPAAAPLAPAKPQTALEKLMAKQERGSGPDPTRKRNRNETDEDKEIAWLEAKLGAPGGLSRSEKGKMKAEFDDDGLGGEYFLPRTVVSFPRVTDSGAFTRPADLFEGLDDLEGAAFGRTKKVSPLSFFAIGVLPDGTADHVATRVQNYAKLLKEMDADDLPSDLDPDELQDATGSDEETGADEDEEDDDDDDDDDDEAFGEYGISDEELMDPSDDDDHDEMGELGSEHSDDDEMGTLNESDFDEGGSASDGGEEEPEYEAEPEGEGEAAAETASTSTAKPAAGSYVPPHLRKQAAAPVSAKPAAGENAPPPPAPALEAPSEDPRLRRQINGQLNKLSTSNMSAIVDQLLSIYSSNPRAVVSTTMISLLLGIISDRDNLGDQLVVTYAALVAALFRTVGIEFPAGVVARSVELFDAAFKKHKDAIASGTSTLDDDGEEGFEGRPGSKECLNLVSFIAELYNFQVVHCGLVYDFVRLLIESGLGELEVELLSRIVKRKPLPPLACSCCCFSRRAF